MNKAESRRSFRWAWFAVYLLAALLVTHSFAHFTGLEKSRRASLEMMVTGTAYRPFAGRVLVPVLIRTADRITPGFVEDAIWEVLSETGFHPEFFIFQFHEAVFEFIALICFFFTAICARRAYAIAFRAPPVESSIAALIYVLGVPLWFRYFNYIYDPATMVLSTAMVYAILARRPWLFLIMFALGCVNKETAIVFLPVWMYVMWMAGRKMEALIEGAVLGLMWLGIRLVIMRSTAGAPGQNLEWHIADHQAVLLQYTFGSALYTGLVMLAEFSLAFWAWKAKPSILKVGFLCTFIPLYLFLFVSGFIDELRSIYDAYPFVMLLALSTFCGMLGLRSGTTQARTLSTNP